MVDIIATCSHFRRLGQFCGFKGSVEPSKVIRYGSPSVLASLPSRGFSCKDPWLLSSVLIMDKAGH